MRTLSRTLQETTDAALLPVLAQIWGVNSQYLSAEELIDELSKAMRDPTRVEAVCDRLDDAQRAALQTIMSSGGKMPKSMFERLYKEIRKMGAAAIERDRPHEQPTGPAEALYYRGLIAETFEMAEAGARIIIFVPDELDTLLRPLLKRKTTYEKLDEEEALPDDAPEDDEAVHIEPLTEVKGARSADTSIVDDMTTLLAYLQLHNPILLTDSDAAVDYRLEARDLDALLPFLLTPGEPRLIFLLNLALSADLVEIQTGKAFPKRAEARRWLAAPRSEQVKVLADAWRESAVYRDLWHIPGLFPEPGGALDSYDAAAVRAATSDFLADLVPAQEWWSLDAFIEAVKETDPDFQRPGGYESWYIRNEAGEYLQGFESWDAIEGALLEHYVMSPLHWLGLVDVAEDAARLTAYGRAFLGLNAWPQPAEGSGKITVRDDGTLLISRKVSRIDRFQAARFTTWGTAGDPYTYKLDGRGLARGNEQGITTEHVGAFLAKTMEGSTLPPPVVKLLETWKGGAAASATLEQLLVLRTTASETLDQIYDTPALRRYLGARLGPTAVIVRADSWEALRDALATQGIRMETP